MSPSRGHRLATMDERRVGVLPEAWAAAPLASQWTCVATLVIPALPQASVFQDLIVQFPGFGRRTLAACGVSRRRCRHFLRSSADFAMMDEHR